MADETGTVLELRGITKRYPGIVADDNVDFDLRRGEVHALLGENGAGKSTLMNILYGLTKPDEGEILVGGKQVSFSSAKDAIETGIGMVHQHFMLIPVMTVAENIVLGIEPKRDGVLLDERAARRRVEEIARTFNFSVDPGARVDGITVGQQQRVEIMKALYRNADILILDEPTAVLTPQEAADLFEILRTLRREGISIVFISHKLNEVLEIADRITVLRRGKKIDTVDREGATEEGLARMMVGRDVLLRVDKEPASPTEVALSRRGSARARRPRVGEGARRLVQRAERRDRRRSPASTGTGRASWSRRSPACAGSRAARLRSAVASSRVISRRAR